MRSWLRIVRILVGVVVAAVAASGFRPAPAAEPAQAMLDGLRQREYYDTALDYLESIRTNPHLDKAFLEALDYETGVTLIAGIKLLPAAERPKQLDEARNRLEKFLAEHPGHSLALRANIQLANLLIENGRYKMELARQPNRSETERNQLAVEARALFQKAQEKLTGIDAMLAEKHKQYKTVDPNDVKRIAERNQVRADIMQTRLALATMVYEIARTYPPGSNEHKENLQAAARQFGEYFKKYSRWLGGQYARIDEARCYQELGEYDKTFAILGELMAQTETDDAMRRMRTAATTLFLQTALLPEVKKYKEALDAYRSWEQSTARRGDSSEEALELKYLAGETALELAREQKSTDQKTEKQRRDNLRLAKDLFGFVTRFPGEYRHKARMKLADPLLGGGQVQVEPPKTFQEARERGQVAWDRLQDPSLKVEELSQLRAEALQNFQFALTHAPAGTTIEDLNIIRYCLAYLYWATDEFYHAAILGEFLARRYPDRPEAQQGAKIALVSYSRLFDEAVADADRRFETEHMTTVARWIADRWPNTPLADEAWAMLIRAAVSNRDAAKAAEYLANVSSQSPRRGEMELMTGQALWSAYLEAARLPNEQRPPQAALTGMFNQARLALEAGVGRLRESGGEVSYSLAAAVLSLAQICLESGEGEKAVAWLDDPQIGPHTLVTAKNPAAERGNFRVETLKAALRAYVAIEQFDKAQQVMNELEQTGSSANLTQIYISLGRQLEESLRRLQDKGEQEQAAKVARGFTAFLNRICQRPAAETNFNTLTWVAEMYMSLGAAADPGTGKPPAEATEHYQQAADVYRRVIEASRADANYAPQPAMVYSVQIRLAQCLRRMGRFEEAIDTLVAVLKAQNNLLDAQREAALTYQAWGAVKPDRYIDAIRGAREVTLKDGTKGYLAWGWGGLARRVQFSDAHRDVFHEARYNLALCRYKYAMAKPGQRAELLVQAERDIALVYKLFPNMGGDKWRGQYDALLKQIQKQRGLQQRGLAAYD